MLIFLILFILIMFINIVCYNLVPHDAKERYNLGVRIIPFSGIYILYKHKKKKRHLYDGCEKR